MVKAILRALALVGLFASIGAAPIAGQGPAEEWRTLRTEHFRVHYPRSYEAWTLRAAGRLEAVRSRVSAEVGFQPAEITDVLVMDPVARPNGQALPFLGWPRMILWTSPPESDSIIGHYSDWAELLLVHEDTHLVHLLRRSRNPRQRLLERTLVPFGPIGLRAPRWVHEGYATLLEGDLTGGGRPHGDLRAAILRRWAQEGRLPSYSRLSRDRERWLGMSMAYLVGSAYLEWLRDRTGPDSLRHLWARSTARRDRSFDEAFRGVFGDSPDRLYDRFRAELTHRALLAESEIAPVAREGDLFQHIDWGTGPPAMSPDGDKIALVLRDRRRPARLVVWSTEPDEEAEEKWEERIREMLEKDPQDVAPVRARPLAREPLHELPATDGAEPEMPRWMPDGKSILLVRFEPDGRGFLRPDLFLWDLERDRVRRVTRGADLRHPDPAPEGTRAVAVRSRHGYSQLVQVDLASGAVTALTEPALDIVYDRPRLSPDGRRLAYLRHREGEWSLIVWDLVADTQQVIATPPTTFLAHPAWHPDSELLYVAVGRGGLIDIEAFPVGPEARRHQVTRSIGGTFAPAPTPEGAGLYFLALRTHGFELRRLSLDAATVQLEEIALGEELAPAVRPELPRSPEPLASAEVAPGRRYGLGRQELSTLIGGSVGPSANAFEIGLRGGDVVGRTSYLAIASLASDRQGPVGGAVAGTWRGWPVEITARLFSFEELPSRQPRELPGVGSALDLERTGVSLEAAWSRLWNPLELSVTAGGLIEDVDRIGGPPASGSVRRRKGFLDLDGQLLKSRDEWQWGTGLRGRWEPGRTGDDRWDLLAGRLSAQFGFRESGLSLTWERRSVDRAVRLIDQLQLGGLPTSLLDESDLSSRILVPALPIGTAFGDDHEARRADLRIAGLPSLFYEEHRLWFRGTPRSEETPLALVGSELSLATEPLGLLQLPALDLRLGVAQILDEPFKNDTRWWLSVAWTP